MPQYDTDGNKVATIVRALAEEGYDDVLVLDSDDIGEVLTDRRQELVEAISSGDDRSVGELAAYLGRSQSAVSRDLDVLFEYDILDYERDGKRKVPYLKHETVLHEPIL